MSKKHTAHLGKKNARRLVRAWQRCRPESLPGLFYAYDRKEEQSERVVTYELSGKALAAIVEQAAEEKDFNFVIRLGMRERHDTTEIPKAPAFVMMLQVRGKKTGTYDGLVELNWEPNSRFSDSMSDDSASRANALSAAGAYLFVYSWLETPEENLSLPFTAVTRVLGKRVRSYVYSKAESLSILADLQNSSADVLHVHLGNGLAVWEHPFSFRPVIEVLGASDPASPGKVARNATGVLNDDGDSFYDFADPEPPPYEGEGG